MIAPVRFAAAGLFFAFASPALAGDEADVRQAMLNYIDGFYENEPSLIEDSVWPEFAKHGWGRRGGEGPYRGPIYMRWPDILDHAASYRGRPGASERPREVTVFEVSDQTASGKVQADWGFDYVHLAKIDGDWMIVNVVWQSYPGEKPEASE